MKEKVKNTIRITIKSLLALVLALSMLSSALPVNAASNITSSDVRFGMKKGKQVTIKSYLDGVGLRDVNVKLTKYSAKNETITVNGKKEKTKRVKATIVCSIKPFSRSDIITNCEYGGKFFDYYIKLVNLKTGKLEEPVKETKWDWNHKTSDEVDAMAGSWNLQYVKRYTFTCDVNVKASDKVALCVYGRSEKGMSDEGVERRRAFNKGTLPFKQIYDFDKKNKMLSIWKKVT